MNSLQNGVWTVSSDAQDHPGDVSLTYHGAAIAAATITGEAGAWQISAPLPAQVLGDGVHCLTYEAGGTVLGHLDMAFGRALEYDLRAEITQLRAEIDLLKRELRAIAR